MNRIIKIELLCPSSRCPKCERIISRIRQVFRDLELEYDLRIVTTLEEMLDYRTAILPSLFVNDKLFFVGVPDFETLKQGFVELIEQQVLPNGAEEIK